MVASRKEIMQSVAKILEDVTQIECDPAVFTVQDYIAENKVTGKSEKRVQAELDLAVKKGRLEKAKKPKLNKIGVVQYVDAYRVPEKSPAKK